MEQDIQTFRRLAILKVAALLFLIGMGMRVAQTAQGEVPPVEAAAPNDKPSLAFGSATLIRLEWLSYCDPNRVGLGIYLATDIPCSPGRVISFPQLQNELTSLGVLAPAEYLTLSTSPISPACRVIIVTEASGQLAGWLCADTNGVYRANLAGQLSNGQWQLWTDGSWRQRQ
jgi:hypothetical protein